MSLDSGKFRALIDDASDSTELLLGREVGDGSGEVGSGGGGIRCGQGGGEDVDGLGGGQQEISSNGDRGPIPAKSQKSSQEVRVLYRLAAGERSESDSKERCCSRMYEAAAVS